MKCIDIVSESNIQEAAEEYLIEDNSTTGWFVPKKVEAIQDAV
jgi:hypothetical protein